MLESCGDDLAELQRDIKYPMIVVQVIPKDTHNAGENRDQIIIKGVF